MSHYDESMLLDYVAGFAPQDVTVHVTRCSDCARSIDEMLASMEGDATATPPESLRHAVDEITAQEKSAAGELSTLLADPSRTVTNASAALCRALLRHIEEELDRSPQSAFDLTLKCEQLVGSLEGVSSPVLAELNGDVFRFRSHALRMLSRQKEALDALDVAAKHYSGSAVPDFYLAHVDFSRAGIHASQERFDLASEELNAAEEVYARYGDRRRLNRALVVRGAIQFRQKDFQAAKGSWRRVLSNCGDDADTAMRVLHNLAQALIETGEVEEAAIQLYAAVRLCDELGKTAEAAKMRWGIAKLYLRTGSHRDALPLLLASESAFRTDRRFEEAGLTALDAAQAYLSLQQRSEARDAVRRALDFFLGSSLEKRAVEAMRYLTEALDSPQAQPVLQYVRAYVEELRVDPRALFMPPRGDT